MLRCAVLLHYLVRPWVKQMCTRDHSPHMCAVRVYDYRDTGVLVSDYTTATLLAH